MAAKGEFKITYPDSVEMTMTITMTAGEWKTIRDKVRPSDTNAQYDFCGMIDRLLDRAGQKFNFYEDLKNEIQK